MKVMCPLGIKQRSEDYEYGHYGYQQLVGNWPISANTSYGKTRQKAGATMNPPPILVHRPFISQIQKENETNQPIRLKISQDISA
jgi:hypothetical protein